MNYYLHPPKNWMMPVSSFYIVFLYITCNLYVFLYYYVTRVLILDLNSYYSKSNNVTANIFLFGLDV